MTGYETWPDVFNPRQIYDKTRHIASTLNLENEYDLMMDNPTRGGGGWSGYARSWSDAIVYRRDPGEMAFNEAKAMAYEEEQARQIMKTDIDRYWREGWNKKLEAIEIRKAGGKQKSGFARD